MADDFFDFLDEDEEPQENLPKRRGRPRGSKNKPKESLVTKDRLEALYNRVQPYLNPEQKKYVQGVLEGTSQVDPLYEMQLLVRQMSLMFGEAAIAYWEQKRVDQNIAKFADSLRMGIKDLHEIEKEASEAAKKQQDTDDMVRVTERGSALERIKAIMGESSEG